MGDTFSPRHKDIVVGEFFTVSERAAEQLSYSRKVLRSRRIVVCDPYKICYKNLQYGPHIIVIRKGIVILFLKSVFNIK